MSLSLKIRVVTYLVPVKALFSSVLFSLCFFFPLSCVFLSFFVFVFILSFFSCYFGHFCLLQGGSIFFFLSWLSLFFSFFLLTILVEPMLFSF